MKISVVTLKIGFGRGQCSSTRSTTPEPVSANRQVETPMVNEQTVEKEYPHEKDYLGYPDPVGTFVAEPSRSENPKWET